ncbi:hypothetical protein [Streptomyces sp. NPDC059631]|uniref:hypothetical protein n=1 Tax=unclassified Streptomyces TaxID=2593676 RepID=UPI0036914297
MSSTRRANKRARLARRAENDAMRDARRESLFIILSRAQRGRPLSADEAAQLRVAVEVEIREGDAARASERGQQRAMETHRQRVEAAEETIRELEQRAKDAEDAADVWRARVEQQRQAQQHTEQGDAAAIHLANSAAAAWQQRAENFESRAKAMEQRAEAAEADAGRYSQAAISATALSHAANKKLTRANKWLSDRVRELEQRAADVCTTSTEALDASQAVLRRYRERAEQAEAGRLAADNMLRAICDVFGGPHTDPVVKARETLTRAEEAEQKLSDSETLGHKLSKRAERAEEFAKFAEAAAETAEQRLARIRDMADNWVRRLPDSIRTATAAEAIRQAANGDDRPVMFAITGQQATAGTKEFAEQERARFERLYTRETLRADKAEERAEAASRVGTRHLAERDRFEAAWQSARLRAAQATRRAEYRLDRLRTRGLYTRDLEQRATVAEQRAGRYRLAWLAARRDRRADRAAMATELPAVQAIERVRALLDTHLGPLATAAVRRALDGPEPEIITTQITVDPTRLANALRAGSPTGTEFTEGLRRWATAGVSAAQLNTRGPAPDEEPKPEPCRRHPACPCPRHGKPSQYRTCFQCGAIVAPGRYALHLSQQHASARP